MSRERFETRDSSPLSRCAIRIYWKWLRQERQCAYKVILRCVRAAIVAVEKQWVLHNLSVCIRSLLACKAHAPYWYLWPVPLYNIFPHYLIKGTIFGKQLLRTKCVFWFSLQRLSETFLILRRNERYMIKKNIYWSSYKVPFILVQF